MTLVLDGTNNTYLSATERGQLMTLSTAQASTSGTSIDFTSIPSWAKKITVMFNGVSTSGTNGKLIQIGSGSVETSGYLGAGSALSGSISTSNRVDSFLILSSGASNLIYGQVVLTNISGNTWIASGVLSLSDAAFTFTLAGAKTTSGILDRIRLTTVGGTDTFDAGSVNILIEGSL